MKYLVYGSSDFAIVLEDFLKFHELPFCGFIDDFKKGERIVGTFSEVKTQYDPAQYAIVLGVGYKDLSARHEVFQRIKAAGFRLATLIHKNAYVRCQDHIREGAIVMANATVDCNAVIGEAAVLWPGAVVNHDSVIGKNTFLSPSATVCGFVNVGANCFVGAGAVVVDHVNVPDGTFIKANSLYGGAL
jgi:sugar O-acyltransferase (sialic acid O-acetyltransferase NeuD family)